MVSLGITFRIRKDPTRIKLIPFDTTILLPFLFSHLDTVTRTCNPSSQKAGSGRLWWVLDLPVIPSKTLKSWQSKCYGIRKVSRESLVLSLSLGDLGIALCSVQVVRIQHPLRHFWTSYHLPRRTGSLRCPSVHAALRGNIQHTVSHQMPSSAHAWVPPWCPTQWEVPG